jgi:hypothetical protein
MHARVTRPVFSLIVIILITVLLVVPLGRLPALIVTFLPGGLGGLTGGLLARSLSN